MSPSFQSEYLYLFSNFSCEILRKKGLTFGVAAQVVTFPKAVTLAAKAPSSDEVARHSQWQGESSTQSVEAPSPSTIIEVTSRDPELEKNPGDERKLRDYLGDVFVPPTTECLQKLFGANRAALISKQRRDPTPQNNTLNGSEGITKENVLFGKE